MPATTHHNPLNRPRFDGGSLFWTIRSGGPLMMVVGGQIGSGGSCQVVRVAGS